MTSTAPEAVNSTAVPVNPISLSTTTTLNKKNNPTSATTPLLVNMKPVVAIMKKKVKQ